MFSESEIAKKFNCGSTNCSYLIRFGLAPFFKEELASNILQPGSVFVVPFDEPLNRVLQADLLLRFLDNELNIVVTRYFDSVFLGHTRAEDLLRKFILKWIVKAESGLHVADFNGWSQYKLEVLGFT